MTRRSSRNLREQVNDLICEHDDLQEEYGHRYASASNGLDTLREYDKVMERRTAAVDWFTPQHEAIIDKLLTLAGEDTQRLDWLPIESAPKDGSVILIARDMGDPWGWVRGYAQWDSVVTGLRYGTDPIEIAGWIARGFCDPPGELGLAHPTHWMPLPSPPSTVEAADSEMDSDRAADA